jgi:hypothetical protein
MNIPIDHQGNISIKAPVSQKGQYVTFKAEKNLIIVMSSCPQDLDPVNGGTPMDCEYQIVDGDAPSTTLVPQLTLPSHKIKIAFSVDFDAVSHWLGTGCHKDNNMADYSSGVFAGQVGVFRLLRLFKKHDIANKMTWFIPGHTAETFPDAAKAVVEAGAEVALHGYAHEGIYQMTEEQEREVLLKW